jgi:hypothetical protein
MKVVYGEKCVVIIGLNVFIMGSLNSSLNLELMPTDTTINSPHYCETMGKLEA